MHIQRMAISAPPLYTYRYSSLKRFLQVLIKIVRCVVAKAVPIEYTGAYLNALFCANDSIQRALSSLERY